jgi:hypothetical protein
MSLFTSHAVSIHSFKGGTVRSGTILDGIEIGQRGGPLLLLAVTTAMGQAGSVKAWDEGGFGPGLGWGFHHFWFHHWGCGDSCGTDQYQSQGCCQSTRLRQSTKPRGLLL